MTIPSKPSWACTQCGELQCECPIQGQHFHVVILDDPVEEALKPHEAGGYGVAETFKPENQPSPLSALIQNMQQTRPVWSTWLDGLGRPGRFWDFKGHDDVVVGITSRDDVWHIQADPNANGLSSKEIGRFFIEFAVSESNRGDDGYKQAILARERSL